MRSIVHAAALGKTPRPFASATLQQERLSISWALYLGYIGLNRYWHTAIVKQRRVAGAIPVDWSHFDSDRACVECFFGRLKRVFWILRDDAFRLSWDKLEPTILLCVALLNFRHGFRGFALSRPVPGFQRSVPVPVQPSDLPAGAQRRALPRPPTHPPDARVGLTPSRAHEILEAGRQEELQLLLDAFGVTWENEDADLPDGPAAAPP